MNERSESLGWFAAPCCIFRSRRVEIIFQIGLHKKDLKLLRQIQSYFNGVGVIAQSKTSTMCAFRITSLKQIFNVVLPHFNKYSLKTKKGADFKLWSEIARIMDEAKRLTEVDLQTIVNLRASLNLGLSEVLKAAFPSTIPVVRPELSKPEVPHPERMAGFTTGEGCFFVKVTKGRNKAGVGVQLVFQLAQHLRDEELLHCFVTFFNCGRYVRPTLKEDWALFQCTKFSDNYDIIIEFFKQYPVRGVKGKDFLDWIEIAEIIKKGDHLTTEGSTKILNLKSGMNTGRPLEDLIDEG